MHKEKTNIMIVDDSALVRQVFSRMIEEESDMELMATASDPLKAAEKLRHNLPDVMILDIEMPKMDGLTFLRKIMAQKPIPVVVCSSLVSEGSDTFLKAIQNGAVDVIPKPEVGTREGYDELKIQITDAIRAAGSVQSHKLAAKKFAPEKKLSVDAVLPEKNAALRDTTDKIIAIGASTGGTEAISHILQEMPSDAPGIVITQHMPEHFTALFAERLNSICKIEVKEAKEGDYVMQGRALIAPGNRHLSVKRDGARYAAAIIDGPLVNRHRPSVDVLFRSVAQAAGKNAVGVILTGMGDDGAKGLLEMKDAGASTIAQDEESSVVFGMPKEAIKLGGAGRVVPLNDITVEIIRNLKAGAGK